MLLLVLLIAGVFWSYNRQHGYVLTLTIPTQYPLLSNNEHFLVVFLETSNVKQEMCCCYSLGLSNTGLQSVLGSHSHVSVTRYCIGIIYRRR